MTTPVRDPEARELGIAFRAIRPVLIRFGPTPWEYLVDSNGVVKVVDKTGKPLAEAPNQTEGAKMALRVNRAYSGEIMPYEVVAYIRLLVAITRGDTAELSWEEVDGNRPGATTIMAAFQGAEITVAEDVSTTIANWILAQARKIYRQNVIRPAA